VARSVRNAAQTVLDAQGVKFIPARELENNFGEKYGQVSVS